VSYDIYLLDPVSREVLHMDEPHLLRGGTYAMHGTTEMRFNITYNYVHHFRRLLGENGIRSIYGMSAAESLPRLLTAADALGNDVSEDYWEPTEGNAKRALLALVALARLRPDGVWAGD